MAAALYPSGAESGPGVHSNAYSRSLMTDYEFREGRYPTIPSQSTSKGTMRSGAVLLGTQNMTAWEKEAKEDDEYFRQQPITADPSTTATNSSQDWSPPEQKPSHRNRSTSSSATPQPVQSPQSFTQSQSQPKDPLKNGVSYSLPQGATRRVVERYSLDDNDPSRPPSQPPAEASPEDVVPNVPSRSPRPPELNLSSAPRHPALPAAGIGSSSTKPNGSTSPSFMPLSASPTYSPPVSSRQRAYAQQPTFIQNVSPTPVNPVYLPKNQPGEEVCIECAMRDQDMADVDVTSPGVWERESDIHYEELKRREAEEQATGVVNTETPPRPRSKGGKLTEQNLKLWLSVNPREPTARQQTLNAYIKSQRAFLEAEAVAHSQAMKEAQHLDNRMRDAYSQLRRSAYDTGSTAAPDDTGGIRIRPPSSPSVPAFKPHERSHSRDITLLENGMIVEHVDVRKEEREARNRQRREERRARKSSRSSAIDATSLVSTQSLILPTSQTDNGIGLSPYSRLSQASSVARPMSVFADRPDIPRAYSQASFSDMHSLGSPSPRRSRFFGNLRNSGWLSQDSLAPSGMSGSMIDMHVALQRDAERGNRVTSPLSMNRNSEYWPKPELEPTTSRQSSPSQDKKKKKGLAKIWRMVTRAKDKNRPQEASEYTEKTEDDLPLAPPPPLSYLVNRMPGERHASSSTASLPSTVSPKFGLTTSVSPPTAPSSSIPSPTSSRQSGADQDTLSPEGKPLNGTPDNLAVRQPEGGRLSPKGVHPAISEPDLRGRTSPMVPSAPVPPMPTNGSTTPLNASTSSREKSLPPLPGEAVPRPNGNVSDARPRTVYTYASQLPSGAAPNHDFLPPSAPFRTTGARRQSFGGMTSKPTFFSKTTTEATPRPLTANQDNYDEFGSSRRSLTLKDLMSPMRNSIAGPTKRKSRFGLSTLLGRKSPAPDRELNRETHYVTHSSGFYGDGQEDVMTGYAASSRHSVLSSSNTTAPGTGSVPGVGVGVRMSVASRKGLEDLVAQDPEFVAYRYPSQDQRLEMLK
ncbi:hypothetical protein V5O48_000111 [Marasmius crinis-equi]|uniref:Proteophosphoglycan ppg4 n=1 Tax=Marasmius crinis-equi TaxID=585013 RepID=A0ABR3G325_9AGAR